MVFDKNRYWLGPSSWSQKILKYLPFSKRFNKVAYVHDDDYGFGGGWKEKNHSDRKFLKGTIKQAGWNPFAFLFALIYFLFVHFFGFLFFNWRDEKDTYLTSYQKKQLIFDQELKDRKIMP